MRAGPAPCQCNPWESWSCPSKFGGIDLEELVLPLARVVWETWPHTLFRWHRRADQRLRPGRVRDLAGPAPDLVGGGAGSGDRDAGSLAG